jgi:uncharacterized protein YkwD
MLANTRLRATVKFLFVFVSCSRLIFFTSDLSAEAAAPDGTVPKVAFQDALPDQQFLYWTNFYRVAAGDQPLELNAQLDAAAEAKVQDMIVNNYWAHYRPSDGKSPWDFMTEAGYNYTVAGENLAKGFRTPGGITLAWMNSPEHRANLLSPKYHDVGFASAYTYEPDGTRVLLTDEMFGSR